MVDTLDVCADVKSISGTQSITERISVLETLSATSTQARKTHETALDKLTQVIDKLDDKVDSAAKPQWNTMAAWAGVVVVFIGMIGGSILGSMISNQTRIENVITSHLEQYRENYAKAAGNDGKHAEKMMNIEQVVERLREQNRKDLATVILTERRDQDINTDARSLMHKDLREDIAATTYRLDERMQRELNDRVNPLSHRLDALENRANERFQWLEERLYEKLQLDAVKNK